MCVHNRLKLRHKKKVPKKQSDLPLTNSTADTQVGQKLWTTHSEICSWSTHRFDLVNTGQVLLEFCWISEEASKAVSFAMPERQGKLSATWTPGSDLSHHSQRSLRGQCYSRSLWVAKNSRAWASWVYKATWTWAISSFPSSSPEWWLVSSITRNLVF